MQSLSWPQSLVVTDCNWTGLMETPDATLGNHWGGFHSNFALVGHQHCPLSCRMREMSKSITHIFQLSKVWETDYLISNLAAFRRLCGQWTVEHGMSKSGTGKKKNKTEQIPVLLGSPVLSFLVSGPPLCLSKTEEMKDWHGGSRFGAPNKNKHGKFARNQL